MPNQENKEIGILIKIEAIQPNKLQPRRSFDEAKMKQLTESIKKHGVLEPLIVRPLDSDKYELVAGERRYRAAIDAGLSKVPVTIHSLNEQQSREVALLENLQREDLNPIDETEGMLSLLCEALDLSSEEIIQIMNRAANAKRRDQPLTNNVIRQIDCIDDLFLTVGRTTRESFRTNRLPILNLPDDLLAVLRTGKLEYTKAKIIAKVKDLAYRKQLVQYVIKQKLSLSKIKDVVKFPPYLFEVYEKGQLDHDKAIDIAKLSERLDLSQIIQQAIEQEFSLEDIEITISNIQKKHNKKEKQNQSATADSKVILEREKSQKMSPQQQIQDTRLNLQERFSSVINRKTDAWNDKNKQDQIEELLKKLQELLDF